MLEGRGDEIPVSKLPVDGTWPSGTAVWEKRNVAETVANWNQDLCIQCGQCSFVCPHGVIQARYFDGARLDGAPESFKSAPINVRGFPDVRFTLQFSIEDCTGCGLCYEACPAIQSYEYRRQGDRDARQAAADRTGTRERTLFRRPAAE